jgi:cytochrome P450/NADPH-cytochrome P450 reductase
MGHCACVRLFCLTFSVIRFLSTRFLCHLDRLLTPAFSSSAVKAMFADMVDISSQLLLKWERLGSDANINPVSDFTKLTYDTIALCSMSHRCVRACDSCGPRWYLILCFYSFNSFHMDTDPPFIQAMFRYLRECELRAPMPTWVQWMMFRSNAQSKADKETLLQICHDSV